MSWLASSILCLLTLEARQSDAPEAPRVTCSTCAGSGHAVQSCSNCDGEGTVPCSLCDPQLPLRVRLDTSKWVGADASLVEQAEQIERSTRESYEVLRKLHETLEDLLGAPSPGKARCPVPCRKGRVMMRPDTDCAYCRGKGKIDCAPCQKKGRVGCAPCKGKGKYDRACEDCLGSGERLNPASISSGARSACPACAGAGHWPCKECDDKGRCDTACQPCAGDGWETCRKCLRSRFMACKKCGASGDLTAFVGRKSGNSCDQCEKKGRIPCTACDEGMTPCGACNRLGHALRACLACRGLRLRNCLGCADGAFRAWELAGETLLRAGDGPGALEYFELARGRAVQRYTAREAEAHGAKEREQQLVRQRRTDLARLDKLISAARAKR